MKEDIKSIVLWAAIIFGVMFALSKILPVRAGIEPPDNIEAGFGITAKVAPPDFDLVAPEGVDELEAGYRSNTYTVEEKHSITDNNKEIHVDFLRQITNIDNYEGLIKLVNELKKDDKLVLHFSNFGGSVYTGAALFNALTLTEADVHAIIEAPSFSMGAMLPCAADTIELKPFSFLMYHDYSGGMRGKGSEMREQIKGFDTLVLKMLDECVKHDILNEEQKMDIKDGKDIYIHPEDMK